MKAVFDHQQKKAQTNAPRGAACGRRERKAEEWNLLFFSFVFREEGTGQEYSRRMCVEGRKGGGT